MCVIVSGPNVDYVCYSELTQRRLCVFQMFQDYLTFCGIGLANAQLFEMSVQEYRRNQVCYICYIGVTRYATLYMRNLVCYVIRRDQVCYVIQA